MNAIKAVGDWELEVLGVPFGSPAQKDAHGEYFSLATKFHEDKFGLPPAVYYHGYSENGKPSGSPQYIGKTIRRWVDAKGVWFRVVLDKSNSYAGKVWEAAKAGMARASSGSISHLVRRARDGHITEWVVAELSVFDTYGGKDPANNYAVAIPVMKMVYQQAGLSLPDGLEAGGEEAKAGAIGADAQRATASGGASVVVLSNTMEGKMGDELNVQEEIQKGIKSFMEAQAKEDAAKKAAEDDKAAAVKAAVDAAKAEFEKEAAKGRRLPSDGFGAPHVAQFGDTWKYDNLTIPDLSVLVGVLDAAKASGSARRGSSENALKALAIRMVEEKDDTGVLTAGRQAMKMAGMSLKANELNQSTLANFGDEWVGVTYSASLWERIRQLANIAAMIPTIEVPQGSESVVIPLQSTPPTFYKVAQASAQAANPGEITRTVTTSKMGTAKQTLTVAKLGAASYFTGELGEDSLIPWITELRQAMENEGAEVLEHIIIDGDTATGATTNINDIGGTPAGSEAFLLMNGFRKLALVTNTANSRNAGAFTAADFLETVKLMGLGGKNALNKQGVGFIIDLATHWAALQLAEVKSRDVFISPTIEGGMLTGIWGYNVYATANMHRANQDATYGLKANSAGKVDLDTAANNTLGAILAVRFDQWRLGFKRRMTFETVRVPSADATEITAMMRVGLINRDDEAASISYNLTV